MEYANNIKPAFRGAIANLGTGNSNPVQNTPCMHKDK